MTDLLKGVWRTAARVVVGATLASMFLPGCAGGNPKLYEGRRRPAAEVAVLRVPANPSVRRVTIEGVNGDGLGSGSYELLPGSYKVTVAFLVKWGGTLGPVSGSGSDLLPCPMVFEAQAGKTYRIHLERRPNQEVHTTLKSTRWGTTEVYAAAVVDEQSNVRVSETCSTTLSGEIVSKSGEFETSSDMIALLQASQEGNKGEVKKLLAEGAKVDDQQESGLTALIAASQKGHEEVVEILIANGADVNHKMRDGTTALYQASQRGYTKVVKMLLDNGANVNKKRVDGVDALWIASRNGHTEIVKLLIDHDSDVNVQKPDDGKTALSTASQHGYIEIVKLLLDNGADVDKKHAIVRTTALWIASQNGHIEIVKLLLDSGADVDVQRIDGETALLRASQNGHIEIVKLLLDSGSDVSIEGINGETALLRASRLGHTEIVKLLIAAGAVVNANVTKGGKEYTPLEAARNKEKKELPKNAADGRLPQNGTIHTYSNKERIAPLNIKTGGDKIHYFVKLTDWNTDTLVQTIFIRAGHSAETTVPLGSCRLKYAAGENWQGENELFGDETIFSKAEKRFDFTQEGNHVSGYSVELILQTGGNLSTVRIPKSEW